MRFGCGKRAIRCLVPCLTSPACITSLLILFDCRRPVAAGRVKGNGTQGIRENKCCYKELLLEKKPIDDECRMEATAALQLILLLDATKTTAVVMQEGEEEESGERKKAAKERIKMCSQRKADNEADVCREWGRRVIVLHFLLTAIDN